MLYAVENGRPEARDLCEAAGREGQYFGIYPVEDAPQVLAAFGLNEKPLRDAIAHRAMTCESHEEFDFLSVSDIGRRHGRPARMFIYLRRGLILMFSDHAAVVEKAHAEMENAAHLSFDRLLYVFFERLTSDDAEQLEKIEQETLALEDALITSRKRDCVKEIISLRKRLMAFKRYYEQLLLVLDELQENEGGLVPPGAMRYFRIYTGPWTGCITAC
jgi:magnesium transporter